MIPTDIPQFSQLKIHKAKFGTAVWVNGKKLGEHFPCFTPSYWDLRPYLKSGQENELEIRIGADREQLPSGMPTGWDFEKYRFIPGIYDSVELILCDMPHISNVQCVPDIDGQRVRLLVELLHSKTSAPNASSHVEVEIAELNGGKIVSTGSAQTIPSLSSGTQIVDLTLPITDCQLWSPETPFLYEARIKTSGDHLIKRFGMREFRFDPVTKRAVLNNQQRYLRGSNVAIYRFFEDDLRHNKPWDREWVRKLHRQYKTMHWDTLRYCIGFPPEFWYDIADEEGFLIQDEFPIWTLNQEGLEKLEAAKIIPEYRAWMRERWNHPSVVIWDAQNESATSETGLALQAVRHLDYSNRPWENGWGQPQGHSDCVESHPYFFARGWGTKGNSPPFRLSKIPSVDTMPQLREEQKTISVPILINEYDWLWLTRTGQPTSLTKHIYDAYFGHDASVEQRRKFHARGVAALTEFWRCHRQAAGVMHFCGLGYSRPGIRPRPEGGATSDDFSDIDTLDFEPQFFRYVRDSFNPVGLMLDFWEEELAPGVEHKVKVYVINDRDRSWRGSVRLQLTNAATPLAEIECEVAPLGRRVLEFSFHTPSQEGHYTLEAQLEDKETVSSLRDFEVK